MTQPAIAPSTRPFHDIDISSWDFWGQSFDERDATFAKLRREPTISWHPPMDPGYPHGEKGFWATTRIEDISYVSKHPEIFSSAVTGNVSVEPIPTNLDDQTSLFLVMDPPRHTLYRRIISSAFTPKHLARLKDKIEADARDIVGSLVGSGEVDFVAACSSQLPMRTVSDLIGIPESEREPVAKAAEAMFAATDPSELVGVDDLGAFIGEQVKLLHAAAIEVARDRRKHPKDDLITLIVEAEVDGHRMTDQEIGAFMVLLSTAGNDTTKQTTSHSMLALSRFPEQRQWLLEDYDGRINGAIEEFVRYATPVQCFARIALIDTEIRGAKITAGDKVAMFYSSGNRDETVFERPSEFILSRNPNPHVGFGGGGIHYCLGNQIAKMQLRALFRELLVQAPHIEVGEPQYLKSRFLNAIKRLPVRV
ncbi:cytochrome P450 [Rhodococcus koreensis]|uniref:Cytochrome P450 n=1 Tax=Rhodococcus koreensis TaxID=99653 RepID=A0A1H4L3N7_9NOCA|nr:cytochrome P450 [Rhodococcus koreensis]SEB64965.1 Cytochrome P450 [Rhodococcus koreensis]